MDIQILLFDMIRDQIERGVSVADIVGDVLDISSDAAYRRLRGKTRLTIDEVVSLCSYFDISVNHALRLKLKDNASFDYKSADLTNIEEYYSFIEKLSVIFVNLAKSPTKEITTLAHNIPLYRLVNFPELSFFYLYTWNQNVNTEHITYDQFVRSINTKRIMYYHARIAESVKRIPLTEIWAQDIFTSLQNLIDYYFDLGRFENKEIPLTLCNQILSLADNTKRWTRNNGINFKGQITPYHLYESTLKLTPNFSVVRNGNTIWGLIHLFRIQSLYTISERFGLDMDAFLKNIMVDSLYVNGASLQDRHQIFYKIRVGLEELIRKIQTDDKSVLFDK